MDWHVSVSQLPPTNGAWMRVPASIVIAIFCLLALPGRLPAGGQTAVTVERITGGPEVIFEPSPESKVVCVGIAIEAGSAFEKSGNRGVSHFLEHMLFDGTERYTREEISVWVDATGSFLNAFTRKETTVFFFLTGKEHLEDGLEILSQMLLHSIFPSSEIEKERKVILEELRESAGGPGGARSDFIERYHYSGSVLAEPVVGYTGTIESLTREEIIDYYRNHYLPSRMRIVVMGGFDPGRTRGWIKDYFNAGFTPGAGSGSTAGIRRGGSSGKGAQQRDRGREIPRWSCSIAVKSVPGFEPGLELLVPLSRTVERDIGTLLVIERMLAGTDSPLVKMLEDSSLVCKGVSLELSRGYAGLRIEVDGVAETIAGRGKVLEIVRSLAGWKPDPVEVAKAAGAIVSEDAFDREKYHLYMMINGERIALFGNDYLDAVREGVRGVGRGDVTKLVKRSFDEFLYNGIALVRSASVERPDAPVTRVSMILSNGCTVASSTRTGSGVGAVHILFKGRSCAESGYPPGMSEVLNGALERSEAGVKLESKLESLGARIQWGDNPYIPMDDYYLNPAWSFIRLEAPEAKIEEAIGLLATFLLDPPLDGLSLDSSIRDLKGELRIRSRSSSMTLKEAIFRTLFPAHPFSVGIFPSPASLDSISVGRLESFGRDVICGSRMIVTLVSPFPERKGIEILDRAFSVLPRGRETVCPDLPERYDPAMIEGTGRGEGVDIAAGWLEIGNDPERAAAIMIAAEILSRRMQLEIREVMGLAYSTGCGVTLLPGGCAVIAALGTREENSDTALAALRGQIRSLTQSPPDEGEIETARKRLVSRSERRELSSINEAFSAGLDLLLREGAETEYLLYSVTPQEVIAVIESGFNIEKAVLVRLSPAEEGSDKKMHPAGMMRL